MDCYYIYGGRGSNRGILRFLRLLYCLNKYIKSKLNQKYYKGTDDPLYFPYFNHDLKVCPKVKIPTYYGITAGKLYFDEFLTSNDIFDKVKMAKEYYGEFNIEEYNKNLPNWTNEYVYHCYFGGPYYTKDFDEDDVDDEDGNEVDEVVNDNCPIISITKEKKPE